jgi:hypothetical protein
MALADPVLHGTMDYHSKKILFTNCPSLQFVCCIAAVTPWKAANLSRYMCFPATIYVCIQTHVEYGNVSVCAPCTRALLTGTAQHSMQCVHTYMPSTQCWPSHMVLAIWHIRHQAGLAQFERQHTW